MDNTEATRPAARPLSEATLATLDRRVAVPTYDRGRLQRSIVHLGVGGFHRAHQAVYLDELAERRISAGWGERGIGLLPGDRRMADALLPRDCLYTVVERDAQEDAARVVGALTGYVFAPAAPERVFWLVGISVPMPCQIATRRAITRCHRSARQLD